MADDPSQVAFNPAAPAPERYDANAQLQAAYRPLASALLPQDAVKDVISFIQNDLADQEMMKAARGGAQVIQFPGRIRPEPSKGMRSVYLDELQIFASGDYFEKPSPLGFDSLRNMVEQTPILNAIVLTRIRQVARFCAPSEDGGPGFEIRHRDREHQADDREKDSMRLLSQFFQNCGWEFKPRARRNLRRDPFQTFMAKLVRDTLTMDAAAIETEMKRDRSLGIDGLYAVDGSTIRLCTEQGYQGDDEIFALQVVQGRISTAYTRDQLIYEPRNPRTDVRLAGYGYSETELLVRVVTGFLNAMTYNIKGFDENAIPKGLLHLSGSYSTEDLAAFKRYWNASVKGINNAWSLPVMVSSDQESKASFERFGVEFNEMFFAKWMTFLTSIACAIHGMAPDEINFESFSAQKSSLSGSDTTEKLADSKDKGLRPLLGYFEGLLTDYVVTEFGEKYCYRWCGLDPADAQQEWEKKKLVLSLDELRAEAGYDAYPVKELGQAPLNPSLIGPWMQMTQQQQQPDFGDVPGGGEGEQPGEQDGQDFGGGEDAGGAPPGGEEAAQPPDGADQQDDGADFGRPAQGDFGKAIPLIYQV